MEKSEFCVLIKHFFPMGNLLFKQSNGLIIVIRTLLHQKQWLRGGMLNLNAVVQTQMMLNAQAVQIRQLSRKTPVTHCCDLSFFALSYVFLLLGFEKFSPSEVLFYYFVLSSLFVWLCLLPSTCHFPFSPSVLMLFFYGSSPGLYTRPRECSDCMYSMYSCFLLFLLDVIFRISLIVLSQGDERF